MVVTQLSPNSPPSTAVLLAPAEDLSAPVSVRITGAGNGASDITLQLAQIKLLTPIETIV
jgi:hypothetical protein